MISGQISTAKNARPSKPGKKTPKALTIKIKKPNFDEIYKKLEPLLLENPLIEECKAIITEHKKELKSATKEDKKTLKQAIALHTSTLKKLKEHTLAKTIHDIQRQASQSDTKEAFNHYKKHFDEIKKIYKKASAHTILETVKKPKNL